MNMISLPQHKEQQGAALIVALVLLLVLTVLGVASMSSASLELIMIGNEQFRTNAQQAAMTGNEVVFRNAIAPAPQATLQLTGIAKGGALPNLTVATQAIAGSPDTYSSTTTFVGEGAPPDGTEIGTTTGLYYEVTTIATAARDAQSTVVQTIGLIAPK